MKGRNGLLSSWVCNPKVGGLGQPRFFFWFHRTGVFQEHLGVGCAVVLDQRPQQPSGKFEISDCLEGAGFSLQGIALGLL